MKRNINIVIFQITFRHTLLEYALVIQTKILVYKNNTDELVKLSCDYLSPELFINKTVGIAHQIK